MGHTNLRRSDLDIDLESGGTSSEEDGSKDKGLSGDYANRLLGRTWSGFVGYNGSTRGGYGFNSYGEVLNSGHTSVENVETLSDKLSEELVNFLENNSAKDKWRKPNSTKPHKPPRPPRGPSLDAADMKMVKEISELAKLKRKRVNRMKALKKMKRKKASPFYSNLVAMVITIIFCVVIIFQGLLGSHA